MIDSSRSFLKRISDVFSQTKIFVLVSVIDICSLVFDDEWRLVTFASLLAVPNSIVPVLLILMLIISSLQASQVAKE